MIRRRVLLSAATTLPWASTVAWRRPLLLRRIPLETAVAPTLVSTNSPHGICNNFLQLRHHSDGGGGDGGSGGGGGSGGSSSSSSNSSGGGGGAGGMGIGGRPAMRHLTKVLKHKTEAQNDLYAQCLNAASQLQPKVFIEVETSHDSDHNGSGAAHLTSMPLSGAVVAVSDVIDVEEFSTRYGVATAMLHRLPKKDHPFISWLRLHGARVSGKLVPASPLCIDDASDLNVNAAAIAISRKACHYAILNTFIGAAGLSASAKHDVVTFKPACNSLDDAALRFSSSCGAMSIMASRIDDLAYLWEVYTGTHRRIEELASRYSNEARLAAIAADAARISGGSLAAYENAAQLVGEAVKSPPEASFLGNLKRRFFVRETGSGFWARQRRRFLLKRRRRDQHVHAFSSSWQQRREGVLKVGIPIALIDEYLGDSMTAVEFEARLRGMYDALSKARLASGAQRPRSAEEAHAQSILDSEGRVAGGGGGGGGDSSDGSSSVGGEDGGGSSSSGDGGSGSGGKGGSVSSSSSSSSSSSASSSEGKESLSATLWRLWSGAEHSSSAAAAAAASQRWGRDYRIDFIPVHMNIDMDRYIANVQKITTYELAEQIGREVSQSSRLQQPAASSSSSSSSQQPPAANAYAQSQCINAPPLPASVFGTGFFEELPQSLVSTLYDAKGISAAEYQQTLQLTAERTSSTIDEVFVDVDILCLPVLCEPFVHLNMRTTSFSLPFVKNGNPIVSMQLGKNLSVMLVGELGRSTQLLEDAISFADYVKGEAPAKWWKRALFGTQGAGGGSSGGW